MGYHDNGGTSFYNGTGAHKIINNVIGGDGSTGNWSINSNSSAAGLFCGGIFFSTNAANYSEISGNEISNYNVSTFVSDQSSLSLAGFNGIYILNSKVKINPADWLIHAGMIGQYNLPGASHLVTLCRDYLLSHLHPVWFFLLGHFLSKLLCG